MRWIIKANLSSLSNKNLDDLLTLIESQNFRYPLFSDINLNSKNSLKKVFINLQIILKTKGHKKFIIYFHQVIKESTLNNRLNQFLNYWKIFNDKYRFEIPKEIALNVDKQRKFFKDKQVSDEIEIGQFELLLDTSHGYFIFSKEAETIFLRYLDLILKRYNDFGECLSPGKAKNILTSIYGLILSKSINENLLKNISLILASCYSKETYSAVCEEVGIKPKKLIVTKLKPIERVPNPRSKKDVKKLQELCMEKVTLSLAGQELFMKLNLEDRLLQYVLNGEYEKVVRAVELKAIKDDIGKNEIYMLVNALFYKNELEKVKKIIYLLMNVAPVASDKYFLAIVLKRLLARKKRFGDSRSVGKLIRKMIE